MKFKKLLSKIKQKRAYFQFKKGKKVKIKYLNVELTSFCNLNCRYCILDNSRPKGFMDIALFKKIIEEIKSKKIMVEFFDLHNAGETLLHPKLKEFLELLAKAKQDNSQFPKVRILTNGVTLNKKMQKIILESNVIDTFTFSIDGGNKKNFEYIRRGAKWEEIIGNANSFIDLNKQMGKKVKIGIISIFIGKPSYSPEFKKLVKKMDTYFPINPHDWDGSKKFPDLDIKKESKKSFCHHILNELVIFWDGRISPCCADLNGRGIIGDFNKSSIKEIYFGKARKRMLANMAKGKREKNTLCRNCTL